MLKPIFDKLQAAKYRFKPVWLSYGWFAVVLSGCVASEQYVERYQYRTVQHYGENISQTMHTRWTATQQTPINAAISITPDNTQIGVDIRAPKPLIHPSTIFYPALGKDDCYTMKPAIVNGEQVTIVKPCN